MLTQRNVEAELFRGRRLSEKSNREKLDAFAAELVKLGAFLQMYIGFKVK